MAITDYIERFASWVFYNKRGRDAGLITRQPVFEGIAPTITVTSPAQIENSNGQLTTEYMATASDGGKFPGLNVRSIALRFGIWNSFAHSLTDCNSGQRPKEPSNSSS